MIEGRRLAIRTASGKVLYYDHDPDGKFYWLYPRGEHFQRYRVQDPELIQQLKTIAQANPEHNVGEPTDPK